MGWRNILHKSQEFNEFKKVAPDNTEQVSQLSQVLDSIEPITSESIPDCYYATFFEERAGIAEFDGCQSREQAEAIAYQDTVYEWIYNNPPADSTIIKCVYCDHEFDFSNCNLAACGDVYCCHFDDGKDHLRPYLQSRKKEAANELQQIGIKEKNYG